MTRDSGELDLRVADDADAEGMLAVIKAAFAARPEVDPPAVALSETLDSIRQQLRHGAGLVASLDGRMVGCLLVQVEGELAGLYRVSVVPDVRTAGVASAMVRAAAEVAVALGAKRVELLARREFPETRDWWQRHGFTVVREEPLGWILGRELPARVEVPTGEAMRELGERLAGLLRRGDVIVASGNLGAGKTTLTQGIARGLDVSGPVISPTFVLSRVHHSIGDGPNLVHVDAYRLGSEAELFDLDLDETLGDSVTLVEWGAGIAEGLGDSVLEVDIRRSDDPDDETRVVYLIGTGARWQDVDLHQLEETK